MSSVQCCALPDGRDEAGLCGVWQGVLHPAGVLVAHRLLQAHCRGRAMGHQGGILSKEGSKNMRYRFGTFTQYH